MLSNVADKILHSWSNGWPQMGHINSGTLLNVSIKFLYPILKWKRTTGTYSILLKVPQGWGICPSSGFYMSGAFEQLFGTGAREFDRQILKNSNAQGGGPGVIDRCIRCTYWQGITFSLYYIQIMNHWPSELETKKNRSDKSTKSYQIPR